MRASVLVWVGVCLYAPRIAAADACPAVASEVEALVKGGGELLLRVAPQLGARGGASLLSLALSGDRDAMLALGLAGQADALRALRERPAPPSITRARALALYALGDASETATVTAALGSGDPELRVWTVGYLARLRTMRARDLLADALGDSDPRVRFEAARPLAKARHPRARRVLLELARTGPEALRPLAALAASTAPPPRLEDQLDDDDDEPAPSVSKKDAKRDAGVAPSPEAVQEAARARLVGPDGDALRAAVQLFAQAAPPSEVERLLGVARRTELSVETRALAWEGALRLCPSP